MSFKEAHFGSDGKLMPEKWNLEDYACARMWVCVCVCERERERDSEVWLTGKHIFKETASKHKINSWTREQGEYNYQVGFSQND